MNRIYQGRVSRVQIPKPGVKSPKSPEDWEDLSKDPKPCMNFFPLFMATALLRRTGAP